MDYQTDEVKDKVFHLFTHDHDGYNYLASHHYFISAFADAIDRLARYSEKFSDLRYFQDIAIYVKDKKICTITREGVIELKKYEDANEF